MLVFVVVFVFVGYIGMFGVFVKKVVIDMFMVYIFVIIDII